jgi:uncharacterized protein YndB with AHSA1/START domain
MEQVAIESTVWIAAPREKVWHAVTTPRKLEQWYAVGCPWEIPALQIGAVVKFHNAPDDILSATIAVLDVPEKFVLHWHPYPQTPAARIVTTFMLIEDNGGTTITITESGFETLEGAGCENAMPLEDIEAGYAVSLQTLKTLLEA